MNRHVLFPNMKIYEFDLLFTN